jgi:hypothetical protein
MTHDGIIGHCGGVGTQIGTLTITDDQTGEVIKVKKFSRGLAIFVYTTGAMPHKQTKQAEKRIKKLQHRFYEAVRVGNEDIHYDAKAG